MEPFQRQALDKCMIELTANLDPHDVMARMIAEGIMQQGDVEEFEMRHTRKERVQTFIVILQKKGKTAFPIFLQALTKFSYYEGVVTKLKESEDHIRASQNGGATNTTTSILMKKAKKIPPPVPPKPRSSGDNSRYNTSASSPKSPCIPNSLPVCSSSRITPSSSTVQINSNTAVSVDFQPAVSPLSDVSSFTMPSLSSSTPVSSDTAISSVGPMSEMINDPDLTAIVVATSLLSETNIVSSQCAITESKKSCEELFESLVDCHFEPLKEKVFDRSFSELVQAKSTILREYDQQANGPAKDDVREECELALDREITFFEIPIADFAYTDAVGKHRKLLDEIVASDRYDEDEIHNKFEVAGEGAVEEFRGRCKGINTSKVNQNESALRVKMEDKKEHFLKVNRALSNGRCQELRAVAAAKAFNEGQALLQMVCEKDSHCQVDIISSLQKLKEKHLQNYDSEAKGPAKQSIRDKCSQNIERDFLRVQKAVAGNALEDAMKMYHTNMNTFGKAGPHDEDILTKKHVEVTEQTRDWFDLIVKGFDDSVSAANRKLLEILTECLDEQIVALNFQKSLKFCQDIAIDIIKKTVKLVEKLIPILNLENMTTKEEKFERLEKLKEDALKEYDSQAKGPYKDTFRLVCEERIDRVITSNRKLLMLYTLIRN